MLWVNGDSITPTDASGIPTGKILPVEDTPFDFRTFKPLGRDIGQDHILLKNAGGYDHNFVLNRQSPELLHAATLKEPASGRVMEVFTTEPGLQVYTANSLNTVGKRGIKYGPFSSICLASHAPSISFKKCCSYGVACTFIFTSDRNLPNRSFVRAMSCF